MVNLIESFSDCFMFSDPEGFEHIYGRTGFRRFLRWVISTEVLRPGRATTQWKKFLHIVKWKAVQSETEPPPLPEDFPGLRAGKGAEIPRFLPKPWSNLCPWLEPIWIHGIRNKFEATRLAHFCTSRNLPAADKFHRGATLEEHFEVLTSKFPERDDRREWLLRAGRHFGERLRERVKSVASEDAHLSVTNSASFRNAVQDGGRGAEVAFKFRAWASTKAETDEDRETWFGKRFWTKSGVPQWMTMCRPDLAAEGDPGGSSYLVDVDFTPGKFRYEDPLYCLDQFTGYQLLQWAIDEGLSLGYLSGSRYRDPDHPLRLEKGKFPFIRATAIGEPGNKSRVVTVGEDWLTILLQPLAHALIGLLKEDPDARAGLSRGWQGFEFTKDLGFRDDAPLPFGERYILSSDLKTATDFCPHGYSHALVRGFIDGLGITSTLTDLWTDLLCSPRDYVRYVGGEEVVTPTSRGILMGDPGSKLVLSLFNKAAELEARLRYSLRFPRRASGRFLARNMTRLVAVPGRAFALAGDDHLAMGPRRYLQEITRSHIRNGMEVSTSTNFLSKIAGFYCEEIIFVRDDKVMEYWGAKVPLYKFEYERNPHVDALKIRLFSPCQKEHEGKNETNPAIGMARTLRGMIAWIMEGWESLKIIGSMRFRQRMRKLIPTNLAWASLPQSLGGISCPVFDLDIEDILGHLDKLDDDLKESLCLCFRSDPSLVPLKRAVGQIPTISSIRGIDANEIEEEVRKVLSSELCEARSVNDFASLLGIDPQEWGNKRYRDRLTMISRSTEYISVSTAVSAVMRPYVFRDILFPEESLKHGIDPFRKQTYTQLNWEKRLARFKEALPGFRASPGLKEQFESVDSPDYRELVMAVLGSLSDTSFEPDSAKETVFIPRKVVYTPTLCTLRTPGIF